jgi:hypothetical protein
VPTIDTPVGPVSYPSSITIVSGVDSYVTALAANPARGRCHGIIHASLPTDRAIDLIASMQRTHQAGYAEPSPAFTWWIGDTYAGNFGPERSRRLNPFRTFQWKGIRWAGSSDLNVTPFPARYGIWSAVVRQPLLGIHGGDPFGREVAIDVRPVLRAFTIDAADQLFLERRIGSLEPGKYADLVVWNRDPYTIPPADLEELRALMTIFHGAVVFDGRP